jgi:hypothetical protein
MVIAAVAWLAGVIGLIDSRLSFRYAHDHGTGLPWSTLHACGPVKPGDRLEGAIAGLGILHLTIEAKEV